MFDPSVFMLVRKIKDYIFIYNKSKMNLFKHTAMYIYAGLGTISSKTFLY